MKITPIIMTALACMTLTAFYATCDTTLANDSKRESKVKAASTSFHITFHNSTNQDIQIHRVAILTDCVPHAGPEDFTVPAITPNDKNNTNQITIGIDLSASQCENTYWLLWNVSDRPQLEFNYIQVNGTWKTIFYGDIKATTAQCSDPNSKLTTDCFSSKMAGDTYTNEDVTFSPYAPK